MNNRCINIAIFGLGLLTTENIKKKLTNNLPKLIKINWTNIADIYLDGVLVNNDFFDNIYIQRLINEKKIPYLKITKHADELTADDPYLLCTPITDECHLKQLIDTCLLTQANAQALINHNLKKIYPQLNYQFFNQIFDEYSRKLLLTDQFGTVAIIDHYAHCAWPEALRCSPQTDASIEYCGATISDIVKISRKHQLNLENWLFELIWNSDAFIELPDPSAYFKIHYWPQPICKDRKMILQLSAAFMLGAKIDQIAEQLKLPLDHVQKFVVANQSINNAIQISMKEAGFANKQQHQKTATEPLLVRNFFQKLKRRFGF